MLWLKLRSIDRRELLEEFCGRIGVPFAGAGTAETLWKPINSNLQARQALDDFMRLCKMREGERIEASFENIRSNLYKMKHFHWGGGYRNSLDKAIVSRYVKTDSIVPFDELAAICKTELLEMSRGYLLNSWYNYWSSVIIENLFKRNDRVMPAYGKIKNVDFFVDDFPFDLKVTYLPKEYARGVRRNLRIDEPLKTVKAYARKNGISFSKNADADSTYYEITERMRDSGMAGAKRVLAEIAHGWSDVVSEVVRDGRSLAKWLYENQGEMRFGAENRIFLVLIDMADPENSWKLKRNVDLMAPKVDEWVRSFDSGNVNKLLTRFSFNGKRFEAYSDVIFVVKR